MTGTMSCSCCGVIIPVTTADIGKSVVCPNSRQLIPVARSQVTFDPIKEPKKSGSSLPLVVIGVGLLALLLLCGGLSVSWFAYFAPKKQDAIDGTHAVVSTPIVEVPSKRMPEAVIEPTVVTPQEPLPDTEVTLKPTEAMPQPAPVLPARPEEVTPKPQPKAPPVETPEPKIAPKATPTLTPAPVPQTVVPRKPIDETTPSKPGEALKPRIIVKRIDTRSADELEKELLAVREVSLDAPGDLKHARILYQEAQRRLAAGFMNPGPVLLTNVRQDLAQLPFVMGPRTVLGRDAAENLNALSRKFRTGLLQCIAADDPRPNPALVEAWLMSNGEVKAEWRSAAAVPCLRQMLPGELAAVRRIACEVYRTTEGPEALDALISAAIFDTDFETRNAAVFALSERPREEVIAKLVAMLDYPWTRAVEHTIEALVALKADTTTGVLAVWLDRANPAATTNVAIGSSSQNIRKEMVKTNHMRNCMLCHAPSFDASDKVRAAIPDPTQPIAVAAYYSSSKDFVRADTTFLRQDFSVVQPVPNPGPWPAFQRYDYLIATRNATDSEAAADDEGRRLAFIFGLKELTGTDKGSTAADWASLRAKDAPPMKSLLGITAQFLSLRANPVPLLELFYAEFGVPFMALSEENRIIVLANLRRFYREPGRLALIAYLEDLLLRGNAAERESALALLARVRDEAEWGKPLTDEELKAALKGLKSNNDALRRAAGRLITEDSSEFTKRYRDLLLMLRSDDVELRRLAADAFTKFTHHQEEIHVALAKAARDEDEAVRILVMKALSVQPTFHENAAEELALSYLAKFTWADANARANFFKTIVALLTPKAGLDEVWFAHLIRAATGATPTDAPAADIAKLLRIHKKIPLKFLPDIVRLLGNKDYAGVASELLQTLPRESCPFLIDALKSDRASERAAAAKLLGQIAVLGRANGVTRDQWREVTDALTAMITNEKDPEARIAATNARTALTK